MRFTIASFAAFVASAAALQVTSPTKNEDVDLSDLKIEWSSVSTDPSSFDIYLVNQANYPTVDKLIASDVKTSDGSYTADVSGVSSGTGFQVNLISTDAQNSGILAQSSQFNVTSSSSSSTTSSSSSTKTSTASSTSTGKSTTTDATTSSTTTGASSTTSGSSILSSSATSLTVSSSAIPSSTSGSSTLATSASSTASGASSADASSSTASSTSVPNGAGSLMAPAAAGSILMGLFALAL